MPVLLRGRDWEIAATAEGLRFEGLELPPPGLPGVHQAENAAIAMMALRAAGFELVPEVLAAGLRAVEWPARLQRLRGALLGLLPAGSELWLDGAHNPGGAEALAAQLQDWAGPTAVSYTHLDVYKRQECGGAVYVPGVYLALPDDGAAGFCAYCD